MNRVSALQQIYLNQKSPIFEQQVKENKCWKGKYRFYFIWMLISILVGGIPLIIFVIMYTKQQNITTVSPGGM
jgi:hypothetical protein